MIHRPLFAAINRARSLNPAEFDIGRRLMTDAVLSGMSSTDALELAGPYAGQRDTIGLRAADIRQAGALDAVLSLLDAAQARGLRFTLQSEADPSLRAAFGAMGGVRRAYLERIDPDRQPESAVALLHAVDALRPYLVRTQESAAVQPIALTITMPTEPLKVVIIDQPDTTAVHSVARDSNGRISTTATHTTVWRPGTGDAAPQHGTA